jgi:hypothetical protein
VTTILVRDVSLPWCALPVPVLPSGSGDIDLERRTTPRYPCLLRARLEWGPRWPTLTAQVQNISAGGLGLLLGGRRPSDAECDLELLDNAGQHYACLHGRVVWAEPLQSGLWQAGWKVLHVKRPGKAPLFRT